jgi:hypothetical protein
MRRRIVSIALVCSLFVAIPGISQTSTAQLTGVVTDQSGALIPGVTITLTKADTGVVTTAISNEAGVYNLPGLQPGSGYRVSAALPGFQTLTYTDLTLGVATTSQRNFQLQVATAATTVEVTVQGLQALTETSSVGTVLPEEKVRNLPLVGNNVVDLLNILPGVRFNGTGAWMGDYANTIGGQSLDSLNVTLDGVPTRDERFSASSGTFQSQNLSGGTGGGQSQAFIANGSYTGGNALLSTTTLNPDLVGEIKLILAPVDAELGRGNSQIQITTRSGTNRYTGAAVWNIQNTSLNPNTWNRNNDRGNLTTGCKIKGQAPPCWNPTQPDWRNTNQYTISFGGPIVRNKTFFFVLWDQQISNTRSLQTNTVLTDTARQGIYRYFEGWVPGRADVGTTTSTSDPNPTRPSVDFSGNPLAPSNWQSGAAYTGRLVCFSIFGTVKADGSPFGPADCPSGTDVNGRAYTGVAMTPPGAAPLWDTKRPTASAAALGYFNKLMQKMPRANEFAQQAFGSTIDGLNVASFRWLLTRSGGNDLANGAGGANAGQNALVGSAAFQDRKQINVKIDQNFGSHRLSGHWTYQLDDSTSPIAGWPDGFSGTTGRRPQTVTVNVTSTLSPSLLNEGRFGLNLNKATATNPWNSSDSSLRDDARSFMLQGGASRSGNGQLYDVLVGPASGGLSFDGGLMNTTPADTRFTNPLYDISDTLSWTHGKHAFKFGGDLRYPRSDGTSLQPIPRAVNGNRGGLNTESPFARVANSPSLGTTGTPDATNTTNTFPQNARNMSTDMAYLLTNSLGNVNTPYWAENFDQVSAGLAGWQDITTQENRFRKMVFNDYSFFVKDDWKLSPSLTLNLGVRYEYYAPPYITSGLTSTITDQGNGLFGVGRGAGGLLFDNWLSPGSLYFTGYGTNGTGPGTNGLGSTAVTLNCSSTAVGTYASRLPAPNCDPNLQTNVEFIGPNSPNPDKTIIPRDRNNFGPAIGFAWQVPWFGQGKTTVRGGYQLIFQRVSIGEGTLASALGGFLDQFTFENDPAVQAIAGPAGQNRAVLLSDLPALVPVPPTRAPGRNMPVYSRTESLTAFDPGFDTPYTQNITLTVNRQLSRAFNLEVRYVGALSRKQPGTMDLNQATVYQNKELFDAFLAARRGENPVLLDQMFAGLDLAGTGNSTWSINGQTGTYPTDNLYGPVGTCTQLVDIPGFQTPPLASDPRCPGGGIFNSGAEHLRHATAYGGVPGFFGGTVNPASNSLADGAFAALTNQLAGDAAPTGGLQPLIVPVGGTTPSQRILRNGCDRIANGLYDPSAAPSYPTVDPTSRLVGTGLGNIPTRCFPENYLVANPQVNAANFNANLARNNYHSLQLQLTMRPVHGLSFQGSYTWAKSMGLPSSGYNDPLNRDFDRQLGNERAHDFRMNGTAELPFGPNKLFFANSSGWVARLIERWQMGFIFTVSSGAPQSLTGAGIPGGFPGSPSAQRYASSQNFQPYGNARLNPTEFWKIPHGHVEFNGTATGNAFGIFGNNQSDLGTYFGSDIPGKVGSFTTVIDPQCSDPTQVVQVDSKGYAFATSAGGCDLRALALRVPAGTPGSFFLNQATQTDPAVYMLVQPKPGQNGVLTPNSLTRFGNWAFDANIQKAFRISESKQLTIRIDARNVLNHPEPFIPLFTTNNQFISQFGVIECGCGDSKSGTRTFQGQVRLTF